QFSQHRDRGRQDLDARQRYGQRHSQQPAQPVGESADHELWCKIAELNCGRTPDATRGSGIGALFFSSTHHNPASVRSKLSFKMTAAPHHLDTNPPGLIGVIAAAPPNVAVWSPVITLQFALDKSVS